MDDEDDNATFLYTQLRDEKNKPFAGNATVAAGGGIAVAVTVTVTQINLSFEFFECVSAFCSMLSMSLCAVNLLGFKLSGCSFSLVQTLLQSHSHSHQTQSQQSEF